MRVEALILVVFLFDVTKTEHLRLALYDALGREVAVLRGEVLPAGGHEAMLELHGLANGIYLVRMTAGSHYT